MSGGDTAIVGCHQAALSAYVRSLVDSPPVAADIVQETWVRAIPALRSGRVENPRAFLCRVARNLVNDRARESGKWRPWLAEEAAGSAVADDSPDAERRVLAADRLRMVRGLVADLPPRCREVFTLRKFDGLDQADIADRLGITRGAVEKQLRIALLTLASRLGEIEEEA